MSTGSVFDRVTLRGGQEAPRLVFGTALLSGPTPIHHALKAGYRAFDTAQRYGNEHMLGQALKSHPEIKRDELFIISKVSHPSETFEDTLAEIRASVSRIGLGYVNLFLIHNPKSGPKARRMQWEALERAKQEGLVRAIGVSNFVVRHLDELKAYATELPAVNQIELTVFYQDREVVQWCSRHGVQIQSFAPLARSLMKDDPGLLEIAREVGQPWNKIMLRWNWQKGYATNLVFAETRYMVTCKSDNEKRIIDNASIFDFRLSSGQMLRIDALDCGVRMTPGTIADPADRKRYYENIP